MPPSGKWRKDKAHHDTHRKFVETGRIDYASLEIGRWVRSSAYPGDPPLWALHACASLYDKSQTDIESIIDPTQGGRPSKSDYEIIDRVAERHLRNDELSTQKMLVQELEAQGSTNIESDLRRLTNYWGRESRGQDDKTPNNAHINRLARKYAIAKGFGNDIPKPD